MFGVGSSKFQSKVENREEKRCENLVLRLIPLVRLSLFSSWLAMASENGESRDPLMIHRYLQESSKVKTNRAAVFLSGCLRVVDFYRPTSSFSSTLFCLFHLRALGRSNLTTLALASHIYKFFLHLCARAGKNTCPSKPARKLVNDSFLFHQVYQQINRHMCTNYKDTF